MFINKMMAQVFQHSFRLSFTAESNIIRGKDKDFFSPSRSALVLLENKNCSVVNKKAFFYLFTSFITTIHFNTLEWCRVPWLGNPGIYKLMKQQMFYLSKMLDVYLITKYFLWLRSKLLKHIWVQFRLHTILYLFHGW